VDRPCDSLSLVPTLLTLLGRLPADRYPGPIIEEMVTHGLAAGRHACRAESRLGSACMMPARRRSRSSKSRRRDHLEA